MNYSLLQLQTLLSQAVAGSVAGRGVWVTAELSDVRQSGGHLYMELVEKNEAGVTVAKMRGAIWANRLGLLRRKFIGATGRDITTGIKVLVGGAATHHPVYGLSFIVSDIDPSYTMGDMERLRREILERLAKEGLAGINRSLPVPVAPQRIAVITAPGAAGCGDFMDQLVNNAAGLAFYPKLYAAVMQGSNTSASVRAALERIEETIDLWDCVVIVRGGGATTDLNGFDDYELARAVATFPVPVAVGIGHERDRTVLDELACIRCKTPTAVAAWIVDNARATLGRITELCQGVQSHTVMALRGEAQRVAQAAQQLPVLVRMRLDASRRGLDNSGRMLGAVAGQRLQSEARHLALISGRVPEIVGSLLAKRMERLAGYGRLLEALDPQRTLQRGYSVTRVNGKAVTDASVLQPGVEIETTLASGSVRSRIAEIDT